MKFFSRQVLFIVVVIVLVIYLLVLFCRPKNLTRSDSITLAKNLTSSEQKSTVGLPLRLKIPVIRVDAVVEDVGLTSAGAMESPSGPATTAWFKLGVRPGEFGSAVIAGHFGTWKTGQGSVFDNLHNIKIGDQITVIDDKGVTINFIVREIKSFASDADSSSIFYSADGKSHLNLITCEGEWNKITKSYPDRLVIFADRE